MSYDIKAKLESFKSIEIPLAYASTVAFNHYETLKRINYYLNDKFLERNDTAIFWNLSTPLIPHFAKNIDLDTKDLQPYGIGETNYFQTWILKMKFHSWLRENHFAIKLSDLSEGLSSYGSIIWKRCHGDKKNIEIEEVDLNRIFFDTTVAWIEESDVIELHEMSVSDLLEKKGIWNDESITKLIKQMNKDDKNKIDVWEFWGDQEVDETMEYKHCFGSGYDLDEIILYEEDAKQEDFPYYDFHVGRYRGRWLRMGVVERLFQLQERVNALVNQNAKTTEISSLLLLRSREANMNGNVLEQAESGQIVSSEDLQQIVLQNPGIAGFVSELNLITTQAQRLCMTPDVILGDAMPSGTPFRSLAAINNAAKTAFKSIRDGVGETISYLLLEDIFPNIVKGWQAGEVFEIAGDDVDIKTFDDLNKKKFIWDNWKENVLAGRPMDTISVDMLKTTYDQQSKNISRKLEIPKNYFDFEYGIRLNVTGEEFDKAAMNDAYSNALQMASQNPAMVNTPLFKQYLEVNGISWWKLTPEQIQQIQQSTTGATGISPMGGNTATGQSSGGGKQMMQGA